MNRKTTGSKKQPPKKKVAPAEEPMSGVLDRVQAKVNVMIENGEINLPESYSVGNALRSAWIILESKTVKVDKSYFPLLTRCTTKSVSNALLNMVILALSPMKDQCHFIPRGNKLTCRPSYFGDMAIVKRVTGSDDVLAQVVYKGDDFKYEIIGATKVVKKHSQSLANINMEDIVGVYCTVKRKSGDLTEVMTISQVHTAWDQADSNWKGENSTHSKFPEEMAKKTVIRRLCKTLINEASDEYMVKAWADSTHENKNPDNPDDEIASDGLIDFEEDEKNADVRDDRRGSADLEKPKQGQKPAAHSGNIGDDVPGQPETDS